MQAQAQELGGPWLTHVAEPSLVLVVEDDDALREVLAYALRRDGYRVLELADGLSATAYVMEAITESDGSGLPDLVICDLYMPGCSGLDVIRQIAGIVDIDMIAMTAFGDPAVHEVARRLGARLCFDKPFELDDLRLAVKELVG
jgi:two-component system, response regulator, stage 0 sporulation protein F